MSGNTFGKLFCVTTCGESHGAVVAAIIDGCPAGLNLTVADIQQELDRRRPNQSSITTARNEMDKVEILSGVFQDKTLGTPILLQVKNVDHHSNDYSVDVFRPSHADFTYQKKYGFRDWRGGGRASARETVARVAAGAVAKKILELRHISILAYVESVKDIACQEELKNITKDAVENSIVRCPDKKATSEMVRLIENVKKHGDSVGGVIRCIIYNVPAGLGEPVFNKLEADLAKAMLSIPAVKGFEIGSGFAGTRMLGSEHNDEFILNDIGQVTTKTNYSGGIQGGISNGMPIDFKVAFKPVATIFKSQNTLNERLEASVFSAKGRHDPCVLPRAVPIVEAMTALVLVDQLLMDYQCRN